MELAEIIVRTRAALVTAESQFANDKPKESATTLGCMSVLIMENLESENGGDETTIDEKMDSDRTGENKN